MKEHIVFSSDESRWNDIDDKSIASSVDDKADVDIFDVGIGIGGSLDIENTSPSIKDSSLESKIEIIILNFDTGNENFDFIVAIGDIQDVSRESKLLVPSDRTVGLTEGIGEESSSEDIISGSD